MRKTYVTYYRLLASKSACRGDSTKHDNKGDGNDPMRSGYFDGPWSISVAKWDKVYSEVRLLLPINGNDTGNPVCHSTVDSWWKSEGRKACNKIDTQEKLEWNFPGYFNWGDWFYYVYTQPSGRSSWYVMIECFFHKFAPFVAESQIPGKSVNTALLTALCILAWDQCYRLNVGQAPECLDCAHIPPVRENWSTSFSIYNTAGRREVIVLFCSP